MSGLNLNKFLPARKAWRVFTHKVQTKLIHKLRPSSKTIHKKPITKSNSRPGRPRKSSRKSSCWPAFCIQRKIFKLKPAQTRRYQSHYFRRTPSPVYIDQLFIEPAVISAVEKEYLQSQPNFKAKAAAAKQVCRKEEICLPSASSAAGKAPELVLDDRRDLTLHKGKGKQINEATNSAADDMWESLVLASPQMNGINERAEEFINKFRSDMMLQERLARHQL